MVCHVSLCYQKTWRMAQKLGYALLKVRGNGRMSLLTSEVALSAHISVTSTYISTVCHILSKIIFEINHNYEPV